METAFLMMLIGLVCFAAGYAIGKNRSNLFSVAVVLATGVAATGGPMEAVAAATADARTLPPGVAQQTRYLSLANVLPEERAEVVASLRFWIASTSTELDARPRMVAPDLMAIHLPDYGTGKTEVWEKFIDEPYYHEKVLTVVGQPVATFSRSGKTFAAGFYTAKATKAKIISIPTRSMGQTELACLCNSAAPLLRADWFAAQIASVRYYAYLGVGKKKADFEKLVGFDKATAQRLRKEQAAIIPRRGPALNNGQIHIFAAYDGVFAETRDTKSNDGQRNAMRLLDSDFLYDAQELYGTLPNGMFGFFLNTDKGDRLDLAPQNIARDVLASDGILRAGISCARCHIEGLRPLACWARQAYQAPDALNVLDPLRAVRFRQLYASNIDATLAKHNASYAAALKQVNGLAPGDNAMTVGAVWARYNDEEVTADVFARELGVTVEQMVGIFRKVQPVDPVLFSLGRRPPISIRREMAEEIYQVAWGIVRGAQ